jgi:glycosyltransferase involved in cell wall biosynthesis
MLSLMEMQKTSLDYPLVSVVLPVYNGARTVGRAVESVLVQTYDNFELIIINDGSVDHTMDILTSFSDSRIVILDQENRGKVESLNRGIVTSRGELIAMIDADDVALPERLERQVDFMIKNQAVAVVGAATRVVYQDGTERIRYRPYDTQSIMRSIVRICPFTHSSTMIRKKVFEEVGFYDPAKDGPKHLSIGEDYDLWVRIAAAGYEMANLKDVLTVYHVEPGSSIRSRSAIKRAKQQISSRIEAIHKLKFGYSAYFNFIPIIILSFFNYYGLKIDLLFNLLAINRYDVESDVDHNTSGIK